MLDAPAVEAVALDAVEEVPETPPIIEADPVPEASEESAVEAVVAEEKPKRSRARKTTGTRANKTSKPRARKSARRNH